MRRWTLVLLCLALASCKRRGAPDQAPRGPGTTLALADGGIGLAEGAVEVAEVPLPSLAPLVERISPEVVSISVMATPKLPPGHERLFIGRRVPQQERGGSGFIVDPSGLVVTNNHVVEGASSIAVQLADGRRFSAKLVGRDAPTDLALVRMDSPPPELPTVTLGDSDRLRVGDWLLAIGNPFGLSTSVSLGILSATARDLGSGPYDEFLQTDAAINPGNSGGPLFDMAGEVVGVNTAIVNSSGSRIGFAIPSSLVRALLPELEKTGGVVRGALGLYLQDLTPELARAMGVEGRQGAVVTGFIPGSPAHAAGVVMDDVIVSVDGRPIGSARALTRIVGLHHPRERVKLGLLREGRPRSLDVRLAERTDLEGTGPLRPPTEEPEQSPEEMVPMRLGVAIGDLTPELERTVGVRGPGAFVVSVEPGSPAERAGVRPGLVIVEVAGHPVHSAKEATELIRVARENPPIVLRLLGPGKMTAVASVEP
jgi:serine protease Do